MTCRNAWGLALQVAVYSNRPYMRNNINKVLTTSRLHWCTCLQAPLIADLGWEGC